MNEAALPTRVWYSPRPLAVTSFPWAGFRTLASMGLEVMGSPLYLISNLWTTENEKKKYVLTMQIDKSFRHDYLWPWLGKTKHRIAHWPDLEWNVALLVLLREY